MGRTKGSKNKVRAEKLKVGPDLKKKEEKVIDSQIIVENVPREVCHCDHDKTMHYGGDKGHCNTSGCGCLEYQVK